MSGNVVAVQRILVYVRTHLEICESQELALNILAPSAPMHAWAQEDFSNEGIDHLVEILDEQKVEDGVYSVLALYAMTGGRDPDTPNGPGEYWSEANPLGELQIYKMTLKEVYDLELVDMPFDDDQKAALFPGETEHEEPEAFTLIPNDHPKAKPWPPKT